MKIGVFTHHIGSNGLRPSGQFGGGELLTFGYLAALDKYYDLIAIVPNGVYPDFDGASQYGVEINHINWRPIGDSADWIRQCDVLINISHANFLPPLCRRNIMVTMFPQYPDWDVSGFDTIVTISDFSAKWIKSYWNREAIVVPPILPISSIRDFCNEKSYGRHNNIVSVGRFFNVPFGNNKNHADLIAAFQGMYLPDWTLTFVGSKQDEQYLNEVKQAAAGDNRIKFYHDLTRESYLALMAQSKILWHGTGYQSTKPASQEHFGIIAVEALACEVQPFVYNSGGIVEIEGVKTWTTQEELTRTTLEYIKAGRATTDMVDQAMRYDFSRAECQLLKVIEEPTVIRVAGPEQAKIYVGDPAPGDIKVGVISDDPGITAGFATVSRSIITGLLKRGFRVAALGIQNPMVGKGRLVPEDIKRIFNEVIHDPTLVNLERRQAEFERRLAAMELCTTWRGCHHDPGGMELIGDFIQVEKPDVIYINYDPGNIRIILDALRETKHNAPIVAYIPIEGKPVIPQFIELLRLIKVMNGEPILYTRWATEAVTQAGGPRCRWVHHGANHANFRPLPDDVRKALRFAVGWDNKKVLMFVGRNKRTKGFGTLLQAAKILKEWGRTDFVWYLHTWIHDQMTNSSMPLDQIAHTLGVEDVVFFPNLPHQVYGIPYDEPIRLSVSDTDDLDQLRQINLNALSMVERYNLAHIFVNASELEGHGLTFLEAMGCGVPVISVDDQGVQHEVIGQGGLFVPAKHFDTSWHTGAWLAQADPKDLAKAIVDLVDDPALYDDMVKASLNRYQEFKWDKTVDVIAKAIIDRYVT